MTDGSMIPTVPAAGNVTQLDPRRHAGKSDIDPHEAVEAWRAEYLETEPPDDYLPEGDDGGGLLTGGIL